MNQICLYTETLHPRLSYVIDFIQQFHGSHRWFITQSIAEYQSFEGISVNYSNTRLKFPEFKIYHSGLLPHSPVEFQNISARIERDAFQIFPEAETDAFDLFAAAFYLLARVEEYLPFQPDRHGRFPAKQSILFKNHVLHIPVVDQWIFELTHKLEILFQTKIGLTTVNPSWSLGIDVDQFFKYKYKSFLKKTGGLIRTIINGDFKNALERIRTHCFNAKDPFDTLDRIAQLGIQKSQLMIFILSGGNTVFDKNHSLKLSSVQAILRKMSSIAELGIHPSYASALGLSDLKLEVDNLQNTLHQKIETSRQHYIKIQFPDTYRKLLQNKIKRDYSLGYPETPGFRAGTCRAFYWYDLLSETTTMLQIHPFVVMDRTYLDYLKCSPATTIQEIRKYFNTCLKYGGHFHMIWHNSSFDFENEWRDWDTVLPDLINHFENSAHQL